MQRRTHFGLRLLRDRCGISSVEFALVCVIFLVFIFALIDFGRAMWEWNAAAKATQVGVRFAVVNDMVSVQLADLKLVGVAGLAAGDSVPLGTPGTEPVTCTSSGCNDGANPGTFSTDPAKYNATAFDAIVARMQAIYGRIKPENVVVEYRHVGLGFVGNPAGSDVDPAVTVRLTGLVFNFVTPGLVGIVSLNLPAFAATLTGEDHRTG